MNKNDFVNGLKKVLIENGYDNVDEILDRKYGMGFFEDGCWFVNSSDCLLDNNEELDVVIEGYCFDNNVEVIV